MKGKILSIILLICIVAFFTFLIINMSERGAGAMSPEAEKVYENADKNLSDYNSWIGKTSKGDIYINGSYSSSDTYLIYITDEEKIYLRMGLLGCSGDFDIENGKAEIELADDGTDYDNAFYMIKATDSKLQLDYERAACEHDNRIPQELRNITLERCEDEYILAAQSYLRENIEPYEESLSRIEYAKREVDENTCKVVITGLYGKGDERKQEYKKKLTIIKVGDEYQVE